MKQLSMEELNRITEAIIGAAIEVHKQLGPGLLESAYRECLRYELLQRDYVALQEVPLPLIYKGLRLDCGYRLDLLVNDAVIVEVKSVNDLAPIHEAQLLSYLKISGGKIGLLLNFNIRILTRGGIKRLAN
ncbi:MAG TPA: GxxExxY protein [Anaerolineales bacterium]|nr:GxxExxY protein [Anaerolineales bacterium]